MNLLYYYIRDNDQQRPNTSPHPSHKQLLHNIAVHYHKAMFRFAVSVVGLLLLMTGKSIGQPTNDSPRVTFFRVVFHRSIETTFIQCYATVEYTGPLGELDWKWSGPNAARSLQSYVQRNPTAYTFLLFIWDATLDDFGRYWMTVRRRNSSASLGSHHDENKVVYLDLDRRTYAVDAGNVTATVQTKADGTDSPKLAVNFQSKWPNVALGSAYWQGPNADRIIDPAVRKLPISEDQTEYSFVVVNATEADLGVYFFDAVHTQSDITYFMSRKVVLERCNATLSRC